MDHVLRAILGGAIVSDIAAFSGIFFVAVIFSHFSNKPIQRLYDIWLSRNPTLVNDLQGVDLRYPVFVGTIERAVYILAIMLKEYDLFAGFIVMKAFFAWAEKSDTVDHAPAKETEARRFQITLSAEPVAGLGSPRAKAFDVIAKDVGSGKSSPTDLAVKRNERHITIERYYSYVFGNGLSILFAYLSLFVATVICLKTPPWLISISPGFWSGAAVFYLLGGATIGFALWSIMKTCGATSTANRSKTRHALCNDGMTIAYGLILIFCGVLIAHY